MNLLVLAATREPQLAIPGRFVTNECVFFVTVGGVPIAPATLFGPSAYIVPEGQELSILATPTSPHYWKVEGKFQVLDDGSLKMIEGPAEFGPPVQVNLGLNTIYLPVYLSRLRDGTAKALSKLKPKPTVRKDVDDALIPTSWSADPLSDMTFIEEETEVDGSISPLDGQDLVLRLTDSAPNTEEIVLELKQVDAPRLLAVSWPTAVPRAAGAKTPFLVYFHSTVGQNSVAADKEDPSYDLPVLGPYPYNFDYVFYGMWRYITFQGDPVFWDPYAKGLPYQMDLSSKNAVIVLPCNAVGPEAGVMQQGDSMEAILREIQSFMFRRQGTYDAPGGIGRLAVAAFSSGSLMTYNFLKQSAETNLYKNLLKELYIFGGFMDPRNGIDQEDWIDQARKWAGEDPDKHIRCYLEHYSPSCSLLVPGIPKTGSFHRTSGQKTVCVLSMETMKSAALQAAKFKSAKTGKTAKASSDVNIDPSQFRHQQVSSMMLVDALKRSAF